MDGEKALTDDEKAHADDEKALADGEKVRADGEKCRKDPDFLTSGSLLPYITISVSYMKLPIPLHDIFIIPRIIRQKVG